ncbi:MAG: tetratricopeptide repeat protein [Candidatus Lokiarchaeota archaeon]|nr:tetratricopeptide repeat protein [Candidatus Lokiarchaeota archaeon]
MLKRIDIDITALLGGDHGFCFLVGAGISMDAPAGLASARQLMEGIIRFSAPQYTAEEIRQIPNLRYETLVEEYRAAIDNKLVFMRYFDELSLAPDRKPNSIHLYLAKMLAAGNPVMTTNFDHFIERAVGLDNPRLVDVITPKDFDAHGDHQANQAKNLMALYKLHGSNVNPLTREDTSTTVITTLSALGKGKDSDIFAVEVFKRPLFDRICDGRTLVVMGYSGGDDFDVVPMLSRMRGVKSVVWLSHGPGSAVETFKVLPDLIPGPASQDGMLVAIARQLGVEVIKVVGPTAAVVAKLQRTDTREATATNAPVLAIDAWLASKLPPPTVAARECFAGQVLAQNGFQDKALPHFKAALSFYERQGDNRNIAIVLGLIGAQLPSKDAIPQYNRALSIFEEIGDRKGVASQLVTTSVAHLSMGQTAAARDGLIRAIKTFEAEGFDDGLPVAYMELGSAYNFLGELDKALECHEKAYRAAQRIGDLGGIASILESKAQFHADIGEATAALDAYQQAIAIHEKLHSKQHISRVLRQVGDVHKARGDLDNASASYQGALEASRSIGDVHGSGVARASIADLLAKKGDFEAALSELDQAKTMFEQLGDSYMVATTISSRSEVLLLKGDVDGALSRLRSAREIFERLKDKVELPNVLSLMGSALDAKGDHKQAIQHHEQALKLHQDLGVKVATAYDLSNLGLVHLHLADHGKALIHYKKALEIFQDCHDPAGVAAQFHNIAQVHEHLEHYFLARYYYKYAMEREMATQNRGTLMFRRIDLATMSLKLGMADEATGALIDAIEDAEAIGDLERKKALENQADQLLDREVTGQHLDDLLTQCEQANERKDKKGLRRTILLISLSYMDSGTTKEAAMFLSEALTAFDRSGEDEVIAVIHEYLGDMQADLGEYEKALVSYEKSASIQEKLGNREQFGDILASQCGLDLALERYDQAMARGERSLAILRAIGDDRDAAGVLAFMGIAQLEAKQAAASLDTFRQAMACAEKSGDPRRKGDILFQASKAFIEAGDVQTAIHHLTEAIAIGKKVENKDLVEKATQALATLKEGKR